MTARAAIAAIARQEDLNFLLTNRIPRRALTRFLGWFSKIEQPWVRDASIALWRLFSDLDLSEAKKSRFTSMHDCFTRELRPGLRPVDPDPGIIVSPCDAVLGACGRVTEATVLQAKGFSYALIDLVRDPALVERYRNGVFVTLRLTASMYHRFHAPYDCRVRRVDYISGDTWNVNPIALQRIENLFCKNERAVICCELAPDGAGAAAAPVSAPESTGATASAGEMITLVPVAAILVASIRLHFADVLLHLRYRGTNRIDCDAALKKGEEMGWFQHGSTIIVFAPSRFALHASLKSGDRIKMGQALLAG